MNMMLIESCNGYLYESGYFNIPLLEADGDEKKDGIFTRFKNWIKKMYEYIKEKVVLLWKKIKRKLTGDIGSLKRWFLIKKGTRTVDPIGDNILSNINTYLGRIETAFQDYEKYSKQLFTHDGVVSDSDEDKYLNSFKIMDEEYDKLKELVNKNIAGYIVTNPKELSKYEDFLNKTDKLVYRSEKILKDIENNASKVQDSSNVKVLTDGISKLVKSINRLVSILNRDVIARSLKTIKGTKIGGQINADTDVKGFDDDEKE